jgi:hypothetical protein
MKCLTNLEDLETRQKYLSNEPILELIQKNFFLTIYSPKQAILTTVPPPPSERQT